MAGRKASRASGRKSAFQQIIEEFSDVLTNVISALAWYLRYRPRLRSIVTGMALAAAIFTVGAWVIAAMAKLPGDTGGTLFVWGLVAAIVWLFLFAAIYESYADAFNRIRLDLSKQPDAPVSKVVRQPATRARKPLVDVFA